MIWDVCHGMNSVILTVSSVILFYSFCSKQAIGVEFSPICVLLSSTIFFLKLMCAWPMVNRILPLTDMYIIGAGL